MAEIDTRALGVLVEKLDQSAEIYSQARDGLENQDFDKYAQRRLACIHALDAVDDYLQTLGFGLTERRPLGELCEALMDAQGGRRNPLLDAVPSPHGQRRTNHASSIVGCASAAVQFLIDDPRGRSKNQIYRDVSEYLSRFDTDELKGTGPESVRSWHEKIYEPDGSEISPDGRDQSEYFAKSVYLDLRRGAQERLPDASGSERADWILKDRLPVLVSKARPRT